MTGNKPRNRVPLMGLTLILVVIISSAAVQIGLAGTYPMDGKVLKNLRILMFWGNFLSAGAAALGMVGLLTARRRLFRELRELRDTLRPLAEKNYRALAGLPPSKDAPTGDLRDALVSLGKGLESLGSLVSRNRALQERIRAETAEGDAILDHIAGMIDRIAEQLYEIEAAAKQAADGMGDYPHAPGDAAGGRTLSAEWAGERLAQASATAGTVVSRLGESLRDAALLGEKTASGEEQARTLNDTIKNIAGGMEKIAEVTGIINQISEQTNILSINAAIESAHAGSAGAGFAVVAQGIKKLAESTRENARKINEELSGISGKTRDALRAGELSLRTFGVIAGGVKQLAETLMDISQTAQRNAGGDTGPPMGDSAAGNRRAGDESADMTARRRVFSAALETIRSLSEKTRGGIGEIRSETGKARETIRSTQEHIFEALEQIRTLGDLIPGEAPAAAGKPEPPLVLRTPAAGERTAFRTGGLDERGVAVKRPPQTII